MKPGIALSIAAALLLATAASARADAAAGAAAFNAGQCTACHYTEGPAREVPIAAQRATTGPQPWHAGSTSRRAVSRVGTPHRANAARTSSVDRQTA